MLVEIFRGFPPSQTKLRRKVRRLSYRHFLPFQLIYAVAYFLNARTVEPEKQPLLANDPETPFVSRQRPRNKQRTTLIARHQLLNNATVGLQQCFLRGPCREVISETRFRA
jgi:uncharacterized protein VirK/YbjX